MSQPQAARAPLAVVTGGARRLGRHLCLALAHRGFDIAILYRESEADARSLAAEVAATGRKARAHAVDVAVEAQVAAVFADIAKLEGQVHLLVNNVGNYNPQHVTMLNPAVWDATIATNLSGAYYCCFHSLPLMADGGNIVNIGMAGLEGIRANEHGTDYYVSKTGLLVLTRALAAAYAPQNVRVNMVSPGQLENSVDLPSPDEIGEWVPLGRAGALQDIAQAVEYLLDAPYVTGVNIDVAGGYRLLSRDMTSASTLVPLWNRAAEWDRRLMMVREARSFLYLSTYYVEYDAYGIGMITALTEAQRRGVAVNLLIDGFGQSLGGVLMTPADRAALGALLDDLRRLGGVVTTYRPRHRVQQWLGGGQHVKIQVSEAGEAIFGSSNLSRSSFEKWNEYSVALRGPVTRVLLESYRQIGGIVDDAHLYALTTAAETQEAGPDGEGKADIPLDYWLCNPNTHQGALGPLGWRGVNVVTDRFIERIATARHSIWMTSFYFKPVEPLVAALVAAAKRGVQIEVHHSHRDALPATDLAWIAAAAHYDRLLPAGVRVFENLHGEHSKIVLIDGDWVAFGSYNFEHAAHDRLAEAMLISRDARAVQPAEEIFAGLRRHPDNVLVTPQVLDDLPPRLKQRRRRLGRFKRWM